MAMTIKWDNLSMHGEFKLLDNYQYLRFYFLWRMSFIGNQIEKWN